MEMRPQARVYAEPIGALRDILAAGVIVSKRTHPYSQTCSGALSRACACVYEKRFAAATAINISLGAAGPAQRLMRPHKMDVRGARKWPTETLRQRIHDEVLLGHSLPDDLASNTGAACRRMR